jgi:integrase
MVRLALITGARFGELLGLRWDDISATEMVFLETKTGVRAASGVDDDQGRARPDVQERSLAASYEPEEAWGLTVNGVAQVFRRALQRAGITSGVVKLHTLRHTAI